MASIDKRSNGKYLARWREYPGGPQKSRQFDRKVDAERHLVKVQHDLMTGVYIDPKRSRTTVEDFYRVWFDRQPWRDSSRASIKSMFERHVLPVFGPRPIGSVRRGDVEAWGARLPLSAQTAGLAVQYVGTMFEAAVADGLIAANPARNAKRPRVESSPVVPFTLDELDRLSAATHDWFRVALTLGAAVGLRQGEATGLSVDRIDFLRRELRVDRQLVTPSAGEPSFGPPKTARSYRTVPLADVALERLAAHIEAHGTGLYGLVLHENGRPVRRQRFGQVWRSLRRRAGRPDVECGACNGDGTVNGEPCVCVWVGAPAARFHDCRHTYASTLLSGGVSVAAAAEYLGHSPAVLLKTYAHLVPADHDRARSVVQAAFSSSTEQDEAVG